MDALQNTYKDDEESSENSEKETPQTMQIDIQINPNPNLGIESDPVQFDPVIDPEKGQIDQSSEIIDTQIDERVENQGTDIVLENPNLSIESDPFQFNQVIEPDSIPIEPSSEIIDTQMDEMVENQVNDGDVAVENPNLGPKAEPELRPDLMGVESSENPTQDGSSDSVSENEQNLENCNAVKEDLELEQEQEQEGDPPSKKQKSVSNFDSEEKTTPYSNGGVSGGGKKASKKKYKGNNVWTKTTSRKGKKKARNLNGSNNGNGGNNVNGNGSVAKMEDTVLITPMPRFPDKNDDSIEAKICLSKVYKAEKVELSEDRMSAGSCKGYRMVRATRGVIEGAWYFEIKVVSKGETGHTRLGWSTEKGDLQAPVGYDGNSFGYRDIDGSKIHKALRENYGEEGYKEGDVIGFYINLPEGSSYAPKPPHLVLFKGQKYVCAPDPKEDPPKIIPGSEISFYKNGICQGVAFKDLFGGRYYPAASMYTLPNQPNCVVKFNFGPDFDCFPTEFEGRPVPKPMIEVPYHGFDSRFENGELEESKQ